MRLRSILARLTSLATNILWILSPKPPITSRLPFLLPLKVQAWHRMHHYSLSLPHRPQVLSISRVEHFFVSASHCSLLGSPSFFASFLYSCSALLSLKMTASTCDIAPVLPHSSLSIHATKVNAAIVKISFFLDLSVLLSTTRASHHLSIIVKACRSILIPSISNHTYPNRLYPSKACSNISFSLQKQHSPMRHTLLFLELPLIASPSSTDLHKEFFTLGK